MALAAALAAACVLVLREPRSRALAMPVALVLARRRGRAAVGVDDRGRGRRARRPARGRGRGRAWCSCSALAVLFYRRPALVVLATIVALPFRIPVPTGADDTANLLLPLYVVIAAACSRTCGAALRGEPEAGEVQREDARVRRLTQALALVVVVYALQALYSTDVEHAVKTLGFFYVPFAVSFRLLVEVRWTRRLLLQALGVVVGLALLFALVGFVEWATGRLLISNEKVLAANDLKPYFRVNSLFFDPNVYGRFLALVMVVLAGGAAVGAGAPRRHARGGGARAAVGGAGADAVGVELRGAARRASRCWPRCAGSPGRWWRSCGGIVVAALAVVVLAPGALGAQDGLVLLRQRGVERPGEADPGRARMFGDRPSAGFGSGSFADRYRARERVVLLAAVGRVAHDPGHDRGRAGGDRARRLRLPAVDRRSRLAFGGLRRTLRRRTAGVVLVGRCVVAAAWCALLLHTFVYAAFLEDPLTWTLLAMAAALRRVDPDGADAAAPAQDRAEPVPT